MSGCAISDDLLGMIPILTTPAGACLTAKNWDEVGVKTGSYHLASLLLKPGYDFMTSLPDLSAYTGWQKTVVLNASLPKPDGEGVYKLRSPYDGSYVRHTIDEILALITHLRPEMVIFPEGIMLQDPVAWKSLPDLVFPFFPLTDLPKQVESRPYGVCLDCNKFSSSTELLRELDQYKHLPSYVTGDPGVSLMQEFMVGGVRFVESDVPAMDACLGKVYTDEGVISLGEVEYGQQFEVIDAKCQCPTCNQQFTRAYLHHLLAQTPLLCQRFLIQHNIYFTQAALFNEVHLRQL